MEQATAQSILDAIVRDVFGVENPLTLEQFKAKFVDASIPLPQPATCVFSGEQTWIYDAVADRPVVKQAALEKHNEKEDMMRPKRAMYSIDDVLKAWQEVNYLTGEKNINSKNIEQSDSVVTSANVFYSSLVGSSKNIVFSHNVYNSNFIAAGKGDNACNFGIRMFDSLYCASGFDIRWSNKVSKSLYIVDSLDLFECMFCYGLRSKKYCIANMQFEKEEYLKIKTEVVRWILGA